MAEKQAVYKIRVDGDDEMVRAGDRIDQRWSTMGKNLGEHVGGAVKAVSAGMLGLVNDSIRVATAVNNINLGALVDQTRQLGMAYTKFAIGSKQQFGEVKAEAERASKAMLMDPGAVQAQARAFGGMTYSIKTATKDLEALNEQATANNRDLGAELPLGAALRKMIGPSVDLRGELEKVRGQADALGYSGGPAAFSDMLGAAAEQLGHVSMKTDEARNKVTAFLGALTKSLGPDAQKRVGGSTVGQLQARHEQISRTIGEDILDPETGQVKDPARVMTKLRERAMRLYGTGGALRVLRREFGAEEGTALYNFDQSAEDAALAAPPSAGGAEAQRNLLGSEAGKREAARIQREKEKRDTVGEAGLAAQDAWGGLFEGHPLLGQAANWVLGGAGTAATGYGGARLAAKGLPRAAAALGEGAAPVAEAAMTFGEAQAGLASAEMFGGTKLLPRLGSKFLGALGPLIGIGSEQLSAMDAMGPDSDEAKLRRRQLRQGAAHEIAGRVSAGARSGQFSDIYGAAPMMASLAKDVGVGKEGGADDTLRRVLEELANKPDLPEQFQASVKRAFIEAMRETSQPGVPMTNPSRDKTGAAQQAGAAHS